MNKIDIKKYGKRIKEKIISDKELVLILFFLAIVLFGIIFNKPIQQTDELILFNNTQKIVNGFTIYKDFNVVLTPLFYYIGSIFLIIFGSNYFAFRLYGLCIYLFLYYNIYKLFKTLKISTKHSFIYLFILTIFLKSDVIAVAATNYNILAIAFSIFGLRKFIEIENKSIKFFILQGFLAGITFLTKQTIGVYLSCAFIICYLIFGPKHNIKDKIKNLCLYLLGIIAPIIVFALYLLIINSLNEFIDYTVLGLIDFKQNASVESYILVLSLINILPIIICWIKGKIDDNQKILFIYSVLMLLITYPILCEFHSRMALIFSIISFCYFIDSEFKNEILEMVLYDASVLVMLVITIINTWSWKEKVIFLKDEPYSGAIYNNMYNIVHNLVRYIENSDKKTIVLSLESARYNIETGENHGILDCPAKGNMGYNGKQKLFDAIDNLDKDTRIILTRYRYAQEYEEMYQYIYENYEKVDTVMEYYDVYERKN